MANHNWAPKSVGEECDRNPEHPDISGMCIVFANYVSEGKMLRYRCLITGELKVG